MYYEPDLKTIERAEAAMGDTPFQKRLCDLLAERGITKSQMARETGMDRMLFYRGQRKRYTKSMLMACAYYFGITGEEMVEGTDAVGAWYRVWEE